MTPNRKAPLILVVDDDVTTNRIIDSILQRAGFHTVCAFDVAGTLARIKERHPDLILLDISLPDGSGFDICRQLQNEPDDSQTPVLFITAHDDVSTKVQAFEAGGVDYITKPFVGVEVIARVRTHLRLRRAYEAIAELQAERIRRLAGAQESLMPLPEDFPDACFHVCLKQVLVAGGDFYDVVSVGNRVWDYVVADVSGHDLAASFWTAALKTVLSEYANAANSPRDVLKSMNSALCRILPPGVFFTLIYARLNRQNGQLSLVNAGHPPAIIVPRDGEEAVVVQQTGHMAGALPDATFDVSEIIVRPGDRILLYSDGLIEIGGRRQEGIRKLTASGTEWREAPLEDMIRSVLRDMSAAGAVKDDIVLMGIEV